MLYYNTIHPDLQVWRLKKDIFPVLCSPSTPLPGVFHKLSLSALALLDISTVFSSKFLFLCMEGIKKRHSPGHFRKNVFPSFVVWIVFPKIYRLFHRRDTGRTCLIFVTVQPSDFTVTNACTQAAISAAWRPQISGSRCIRSVTPRGILEG